MSLSDEINDIGIDNIKRFNKISMIVDAYVCNIYDGDTITAIFKFPGNTTPMKYKIRLVGINTPEIRGGTQETKKRGRESRDILREKILEKYITLEINGCGKYGRFLGTLYYQGVNLNEWMVSNGYAIEYMK